MIDITVGKRIEPSPRSDAFQTLWVVSGQANYRRVTIAARGLLVCWKNDVVFKAINVRADLETQHTNVESKKDRRHFSKAHSRPEKR